MTKEMLMNAVRRGAEGVCEWLLSELSAEQLTALEGHLFPAASKEEQALALARVKAELQRLNTEDVGVLLAAVEAKHEEVKGEISKEKEDARAEAEVKGEVKGGGDVRGRG